MNMERQFAAVERRALHLRLTLLEVADLAGISQPTLWRARNGKHKRPASAMKVLRDIESRLDLIEAERAAA